ncbi:isochorismatase [Limnohabitans sp. T6-5]|uniref:isochorismatase family protein n=1 Tax=Limnohabitans sp. T6-5 TaxID=1100724 RepID=UPI000D38C068|nr:isochorismatase family protein [Limnohabitans sp. T6-5]PUE09581.1 isochorismatase [Limnohabitans sp. T6-5]
MLIDVEECQLVLVDLQPKLKPVMFDAESVWANAAKLAELAAALDVPIWGTEQNPSRLGELPPEMRMHCRQVLAKMQFSAVEEGLGEWLQPGPPQAPRGNARSLPRHLQKPQAAAQERKSIVLAGCEAHICLMQTALDLLEDEFEVWVVTDACSSRTERNRDAAYDRLAGAGAELVTAEMLAFEWIRSAEHPDFKLLQSLFK